MVETVWLFYGNRKTVEITAGCRSGVCVCIPVDVEAFAGYADVVMAWRGRSRLFS